MIEFEKTAINIKKTLMQGVCYSVYKGENRLYGVLAEGGCATFIVISLDKKKIIFSQDAPGATGSWGVAVASDDRVYFGSYINAGFYRFDPEKEEMETLFSNLPNAKFIFSLDTDSKNNIYGGTWPNCAVFKYSGDKEKLEFYDEKIEYTEDYVRIVLYNEERDSLYACISAHSHVLEYKEGKGPVKDILPDKYKNEPFARIFGFHENTAGIYMMKAGKMIMVDLDSGELVSEAVCPDIKEEYLPLNVDLNDLLISHGHRNNGMALDIKNNMVYHFTGELNDIIMGIWPYSDGESVLVSGFEGKIYLYNVKTGIKTKVSIEIPRKSIEVRQLHLTAEGVMHASGYLRGGSYLYDPEGGSGIQYNGIGQCEGIASYNGKVYYGKYPGAYIYEYDLAKSWDTPGNPRELFELKTPANQDRPFAMKVYNEKLYIGSIPDYGDIQGALTIYDINSGTHEIKKDFSDSRSIISVCFDNGIMYGGTTVCGGLGSYTKHTSGTVFAMDVKSSEYIYEIIPVEGCKNAGGLCMTEDGMLIGCADSTFFIMNPIDGNVVFTKKLAAFDRNKDYKWEISFIKKGPGKLYYIVTANTLFSFDNETRIFEQLAEKKVNLLEFDKQGRLYCQYEDNVREIIRSINSVE